jgi:hypothetical protein
MGVAGGIKIQVVLRRLGKGQLDLWINQPYGGIISVQLTLSCVLIHEVGLSFLERKFLG